MNAARTTALTGSNQAVRASASILKGVNVAETGGSNPASIVIFDNASAASGTILCTVTLAAGEAKDLWFSEGIWAENGLYVSIAAGAVAGSVRIG